MSKIFTWIMCIGSISAVMQSFTNPTESAMHLVVVVVAITLLIFGVAQWVYDKLMERKQPKA